VSDELEGKVSDKQGETCSIIETKLGYKLNLDFSPAGPSCPLFIGGQVAGS
jgi:hypothetical protein